MKLGQGTHSLPTKPKVFTVWPLTERGPPSPALVTQRNRVVGRIGYHVRGLEGRATENKGLALPLLPVRPGEVTKLSVVVISY